MVGITGRLQKGREGPLLHCLAFGVAYALMAEAGEWLTDSASQFSTFWPAAGLYVAALLLTERRRWPVIVAAAAVADLAVCIHVGRSPLLTVATLLGDPLEACLAAWLVLRAVGGVPNMSRLRDVLVVMVFAVLVAPVAGATVDALAVAYHYGRSPVGPWAEWWSGDALGILVVAPLIVAWSGPAASGRTTFRRPAEFAALLVAAVAMTWLVFHRADQGEILHQYVVLPVFVWAAMRLGSRGVTATGFLMAATTAFATTIASAGGPRALAPAAAPVQLLIGVAVSTALILAAALSEQRRTERALRLARYALDHGSDGFLVIDPQGKVSFANDGAGRMFGCPAVQLLDRLISDLDPGLPLPSWTGRWREMRKGGTALYETSLAGPAGQRLVAEVSLSYLSFDGQEYGVWSARDVSDRRRAEATQRLASVGTLAAGVAHEINNPLTYVTSNLAYVADLLARLRGADRGVEEAEAAIREAIDGARRVRNIVRDLKFVSRAPDDRRVEVDIHTEIRSALNLAQTEIRHRARLVTRLDPVPPTRASEGQLGQVFVNLLVNAAHSIPEGSPSIHTVRISTRTDIEGWAVVEVSDTGAGIPADIRARIFEPFFTTKPVGTGTGLGLSICHGIVSSIGGTIEVDSAEKRGTTFRVRLPPAVPVDAARLAGHASSPPGIPHGRVLVVDDEPLIGRSVARMLAREHEVVSVTDPKLALSRLVAGEHFDLVLCDVMMPGMGGVDFVQELDRQRPGAGAGVVLMTGGPFTAAAQEFLEHSSQPHLQKPFEAETLRELLRGHMGHARAAS
ncbi:MAG TPA: MASE1 domain-containing protein [Anaeromyxobacteraceae bacterium]|nr:MASE1 domain-containing protein [Anaeromyxobacteraceae bacterium]